MKCWATSPAEFRDEVELVRAPARNSISNSNWLRSRRRCSLAPRLSNFGVKELLDEFVQYAPAPMARDTEERTVSPDENKLTGFVFKIQAIMDPGIVTGLPSCAWCPASIAVA